jgi:hypothetical protein
MKTQLDDAIDQVAARMTAVTDDEGLAARIADSLPERSGWSLWWLAPRIAIAAIGAFALLAVLRPFDDWSPNSGPAEAGRHIASVNPAEAGHHIANVAPDATGTVDLAPSEVAPPVVSVASAFRRTQVGRTGSALDQPDHEFSLPAIDAVAALEVDALAPANRFEDAPLTIESLEITSLPLTADFPQR